MPRVSGDDRGKPFLLHELLRELARREEVGDRLDAASVGRLGPSSIPAAVLGRVGQVAGAVEVARAVAVLGDGAALPAHRR